MEGIRMPTKKDELILDHYRRQAQKYGDSAVSAIEDEIIREKEMELLLQFFAMLRERSGGRALQVMDLGCGNGYALGVISAEYPEHRYTGIDFTPELLKIAYNRRLANVEFAHGDARTIPCKNNSFDVVYTERSVVNILDWPQQKTALQEIHRVLKPQGYYVMIEAFYDGVDNLNNLRRQVGLKGLLTAYHNRYLIKDSAFQALRKMFSLLNPLQLGTHGDIYEFPPNFLSLHYITTQVLIPKLAEKNQTLESDAIRIMASLPALGNFAPLQFFIFKK
jgi:ubiquinone/menaquinone biosynthesis C-methylase UbiE